MELIFICAVCIIIGVIIGENSSSSKRRSYENHNPPEGLPPLKLKKSLRLDESSVQRSHNRDGPSTSKPEIIPTNSKRRLSDSEIEDMLRKSFKSSIENGKIPKINP
jgi:molecular chaperone DnaK (HSP70)